MSNDIYTYIEDNFNIKVTDYTFKRDYIKEPLHIHCGKGSERPYKEDLEYLYMTSNLSTKDLAGLFNISHSTAKNFVRSFSLVKSQNKKYQSGIFKFKNKCYNKYGVDSYLSSPLIRNKIKKTCLEKYGVECILQNNDIQDKIKKTCLEKYGTEYTSQCKTIRDKIKKTCLEKYGFAQFLSSKNARNKIKNTCLEKYGTEYPLQNNEIRNKIKKTCLEKYGVEYYAQSDNFKNLWKNEEFINQRNNKRYHTMKNNGTLGINSSYEEIKIYNMLIQKFDKVIQQYKSEKYPFACDFYVPELDLYIEYQGYWTHGNITHNQHEPYNPNNPNHLEIVNIWKQKNTPFYERAIKIWTQSDPQKRQWAKEHNLNWLEFFTMKDFYEWFEIIKKES